MGQFNSENNHLVWMDIPVADLERAAQFYAAVLGTEVSREKFGGIEFCVFGTNQGNGASLIKNPLKISAEKGVLVYLNVDNRIQDALDKAVLNGGHVVEPVRVIGPYGYRAVIRDSEGNQIALHSRSDS